MSPASPAFPMYDGEYFLPVNVLGGNLRAKPSVKFDLGLDNFFSILGLHINLQCELK